MSLQVFYPTDIRNALQAAEQASSAALAAADGDGAYSAGYQAGYRAALVTIALAFGLVSERGKAPAPAPDVVLFARRA